MQCEKFPELYAYFRKKRFDIEIFDEDYYFDSDFLLYLHITLSIVISTWKFVQFKSKSRVIVKTKIPNADNDDINVVPCICMPCLTKSKKYSLRRNDGVDIYIKETSLIIKIGSWLLDLVSQLIFLSGKIKLFRAVFKAGFNANICYIILVFIRCGIYYFILTKTVPKKSVDETSENVQRVIISTGETIKVTPVIDKPGNLWTAWMSLFYHDVSSIGSSLAFNYILLFLEIFIVQYGLSFLEFELHLENSVFIPFLISCYFSLVNHYLYKII